MYLERLLDTYRIASAYLMVSRWRVNGLTVGTGSYLIRTHPLSTALTRH